MAYAVALLLLIAVLALPVAAQDSAGGSWIERRIESLVPGLRIEGLRNPLSSRPNFARLTLSDSAGVWLEVIDGTIEWAPTALLRRQAQLRELTAARLVVHRPPVSNAPPAADVPPGPLVPALPSLPVAIRLDRLRIERIELAPPVLGEAVVLSATGSARLDSEGLDLALDAALIEGGAVLALQATLRPGTGRLAATATLRGEPGGTLSRVAGLRDRPLALDLSLDGPSDSAAFTLRAEAGPGLSADLAGTVAAPDTARLGIVAAGRVDGSGLLDEPLARLAGPVEINLDAARMPDGLVALRALRLAGIAGVIEGSGRIDTEGSRTALTLRATLPPSGTFPALLPDTIGWDAIGAEAEITGRLDAPHVALALAPTGFRSAIAPVQALLGAAPRLTLRAAAPDRIELLTLAGQAIQAEARGRVGSTLDVAFAVDIAAPEAAVPGLSGALRMQGSAAGALRDPTLTIAAQSNRLEVAGRVLEALSLEARIASPATRPEVEARLTATLQALPVSLALRGTPEDAGWLRLDATEASLGPARLTASGRVQPTALLAEGEAKLDAPDLAPLSRLLGQPIAGALRAEARGTLRDGRQTLSAKIEAPRFAGAGIDARNITATAEGHLAALDLVLSGTVNAVEAEARGKLISEADGARRLDLAALRATASGETLRLAAPTWITLRPDGGLVLAATTIVLPRSGTLRAEGVWGPERADIRATLAAVNLAGFAAFAPDLAPTGTLTGDARITGATASPEITASLRGSGLRAGPRTLPAADLRLDLRRTGEGVLTATADARLGPQNRLAATARFPRGPAQDAPFEATLSGALDLAAVAGPLLAAGADRVTGRLNLALTAGGTPAQPAFGGEARLSGGSYRNAVYGVTLTDLAGALRPDGERLRADIAGRTAGGGRVTLAGTVEPLGRALPVDLLLTLDNARPVASDLLTTTLDAQLQLTGTLGEAATLSGPVRIRQAEIRIPERLGGGVRTLGPVREIGSPPGRAPRTARAGEASAGPPITLAVTVEAPRNVYVRGRGLDAELGGQLSVAGRITAPDITGELNLRRGDITVIGRRLAFDRGRLDWGGGLLPDLDLRASSQAGSTTVRVEVKGSPTRPEIIFSSTPELPQDEVLARLLFDRPLRELSPFEIVQIGYAIAGATGLPGGGAATGFLERVRQGLALDRLAVGSDSERAGGRTTGEERAGASLEAGRYVSDGVYVGVRQGTDGSSRVGVRVDLTPRLRLDAETGDREAGSRLGLSYEWQWGR